MAGFERYGGCRRWREPVFPLHPARITSASCTKSPSVPLTESVPVTLLTGTLLFLACACDLEGAVFGYFPTTTMTKEPGFILPRRSPGAGGSKSAAGRKMLWVLRSRPMVRADLFVGTFSTTVNLSGESSWMTVRLPSPQEANA